jgi:hypothetical protein
MFGELYNASASSFPWLQHTLTGDYLTARTGFTYTEYIDEYGHLQCTMSITNPEVTSPTMLMTNPWLERKNAEARQEFREKVLALEQRINDNYRLIPPVERSSVSTSSEETSDSSSEESIEDIFSGLEGCDYERDK